MKIRPPKASFPSPPVHQKGSKQKRELSCRSGGRQFRQFEKTDSGLPLSKNRRLFFFFFVVQCGAESKRQQTMRRMCVCVCVFPKKGPHGLDGAVEKYFQKGENAASRFLEGKVAALFFFFFSKEGGGGAWGQTRRVCGGLGDHRSTDSHINRMGSS